MSRPSQKAASIRSDSRRQDVITPLSIDVQILSGEPFPFESELAEATLAAGRAGGRRLSCHPPFGASFVARPNAVGFVDEAAVEPADA